MKELIIQIVNMCFEERCFLFSIVFQVCGALILLLESFRSSKKQVAMAYFKSDNTGSISDEAYVALDRKIVAKLLRKVYYNRLSFAYLVIGYTLTIWSDIGTYSKEKMFYSVLVCSVVILILSCVLMYIISRIVSIFRKKAKWKDLEIGTVVDVITGEGKTHDGEPYVSVKRVVKNRF